MFAQQCLVNIPSLERCLNGFDTFSTCVIWGFEACCYKISNKALLQIAARLQNHNSLQNSSQGSLKCTLKKREKAPF